MFLIGHNHLLKFSLHFSHCKKTQNQNSIGCTKGIHKWNVLRGTTQLLTVESEVKKVCVCEGNVPFSDLQQQHSLLSTNKNLANHWSTFITKKTLQMFFFNTLWDYWLTFCVRGWLVSIFCKNVGVEDTHADNLTTTTAR